MKSITTVSPAETAGHTGAPNTARIDLRIRSLEKERRILLALGNDLTKVRDKNDLITLFSSRIRELYPFSHSLITLINHETGSYTPFLLDTVSSPVQHLEAYPSLVTTRFSLDEPFIQQVLASDGPTAFVLEDIIDAPESPAWLRFNYEGGIREILMTPLKSKDQPIGFLHIYATDTPSFTDEFKSVIQGIAPQISSAVTNIIKNEEISHEEWINEVLLSLSNEMVKVRSRQDLLKIITSSLRELICFSHSMMTVMDETEACYKAYLVDEESRLSELTDFGEALNIPTPVDDGIYDIASLYYKPLIFDMQSFDMDTMPAWCKLQYEGGAKEMIVKILGGNGSTRYGLILFAPKHGIFGATAVNIIQRISSQLFTAAINIAANEKILAYKQKLEIENDYLKEQIQTIYNFSEIVGSGTQMQKTYRLISQVAESSSTVLLLGETGTGKELIARAIHSASPRKGKLMVKVNCAALPAHLIESELFGHEKGAFTGAIDRRIGKFELANHSTLFLDEIGEMPPELQVKLLRVLQERELERIGGRATIKVDVRIIAATNRKLEAEVQAGRFRSDLYYRLNVFPISLPPLRERQEDIEPLANFFVAKFSKNTGKKVNGISAKVLQELKSYHWPGNVRELEHLIERSILLCDSHMLKEIHLPRAQPGEHPQSPVFSNDTLEQIERAYIIDVLKRCSGKISGAGGAAEILEIPGTTLHSKIKKLGISKADYFLK